jgi:hypothetical protein
VKHTIVGACIIVLLVLLAAPLPAEEPADPENPAWLEYEKGKLALADRDYGAAVLHLREALAHNRTMPEAELALGDVYFLQGDYAVAERQYQRAYDQRAAFGIADLQYETLYRLARLYEIGKRYGMMEKTYRDIAAADPLVSGQDQKQKNYRHNLVKLFRQKGFDDTFLLHRLDETFATRALSGLAEYYYRSWNFEPALEPALLGILPLVNEGMLQIRKHVPDYRFTTLAEFLKTGLAQPAVASYFEDRDFFRRLYYLALVCREKPEVRDSSRAFLRLLAATDAAGEYQRLARLQIAKPWREKRIDAPVIEML